MNRGNIGSVAIGVVVLAVLFVLFGGSGGGGVMANIRDRFESFGSGDRGGAFGGGQDRIYEEDDNWWRSHRASHRLGTRYDEEGDRFRESLGRHR